MRTNRLREKNKALLAAQHSFQIINALVRSICGWSLSNWSLGGITHWLGAATTMTTTTVATATLHQTTQPLMWFVWMTWHRFLSIVYVNLQLVSCCPLLLIRNKCPRLFIIYALESGMICTAFFSCKKRKNHKKIQHSKSTKKKVHSMEKCVNVTCVRLNSLNSVIANTAHFILIVNRFFSLKHRINLNRLTISKNQWVHVKNSNRKAETKCSKRNVWLATANQSYLNVFEAQNVSGKRRIAYSRLIFYAREYDATFPGRGFVGAHVERTGWDRIRLNGVLWADGRWWRGRCGRWRWRLIWRWWWLRCWCHHRTGCRLNLWWLSKFFDQWISGVDLNWRKNLLDFFRRWSHKVGFGWYWFEFEILWFKTKRKKKLTEKISILNLKC